MCNLQNQNFTRERFVFNECPLGARLESCLFSGINSPEKGGALYADGHIPIICGGTMFSKCSSLQEGGGVFIRTPHTQISKSCFVECFSHEKFHAFNVFGTSTKSSIDFIKNGVTLCAEEELETTNLLQTWLGSVTFSEDNISHNKQVEYNGISIKGNPETSSITLNSLIDNKGGSMIYLFGDVAFSKSNIIGNKKSKIDYLFFFLTPTKVEDCVIKSNEYNFISNKDPSSFECSVICGNAFGLDNTGQSAETIANAGPGDLICAFERKGLEMEEPKMPMKFGLATMAFASLFVCVSTNTRKRLVKYLRKGYLVFGAKRANSKLRGLNRVVF